MTPEFMLAGVVVASLIIYSLSGGADFGSGVWSFLAIGERSQDHQNLIEKAIAPIWESNHVWVILIIVVLFIGFPLAFSTIVTVLHIPITIMLLGIVLRGSAFIFHSYGRKQDEKLQKLWSFIFGISSIFTPIMFGVIVGAIASGKIDVDIETAKIKTDFFSAWLSLFPFSIGVFTVFNFMFIAAVYLIHETDNDDIKEDFRKRAFVCAILVDIAALFCLYLSQSSAEIFWLGLYKSPYAVIFHIFGGTIALAVFYTLYTRKYLLARIFAMAKVTCVIVGWALSQFPYLIMPNVTIYNSAAPDNVLTMMLSIIVLGMIVTVPALAYLFRIFKSKN